jgi:hypothetical protein
MSATPPLLPSQSLLSSKLQWRVVLLCGAAIVGGNAFLGTLISNISLWLSVAQGLSVQEAWREMFDPVSPTGFLSACAQFLTGFVGGRAAAASAVVALRTHATLAGAIGTLFVVVMMVTPLGSFGPVWHAVLSTALPPLSAFIGGHSVARHA